MNKTQKNALFSLTMSALLLAIVITIAVVAKMPRSLIWLWFLLTYGIIGLSLIFLRKRQSPVEVDLDERDKLIKKRAMLTCYFSLWGFFIATCTVPWLIVGPEGSIPVCVLPVILLLVFIIVMTVNSVAILAQYGRRSKDGQE
jgi:apolipoprotein N-acyltransferase